MDVTPVSPEPCPFVIRLSIDGKIVNQLPIVVKDLPDQWTVNGHFQLYVFSFEDENVFLYVLCVRDRHAKPCSIQFDIIEIPKGKTIASHEIQTVDLLKDFLLRKNGEVYRAKFSWNCVN